MLKELQGEAGVSITGKDILVRWHRKARYARCSRGGKGKNVFLRVVWEVEKFATEQKKWEELLYFMSKLQGEWRSVLSCWGKWFSGKNAVN